MTQSCRLCAIVLTSAYFQEIVVDPCAYHANYWFKVNIAFRTREGRREAAGLLYYERMANCLAKMADGSVRRFSISRAYNPNQVFVYVENPLDKRMYLDHLVVNVGIVHERYDFNEVET